MITFDSLTLNAFLKENKDFLTGARIQKIQQPSRRDFVFTLRSLGETRKFYVNINPQSHHLCFMSKENEERRMIEIPSKPPMFCMLLRKYIENSKICEVRQPEYERILEFYIETYNELSEKIYLCLAIELMGKHSNVVLYNYDTNIILGCAHNVGAEKSREREMAGTLPYVYPPKQRKQDILTYNGEIDYDTLNKDFFWFSKSFAKQCEGLSIEKLREFVQLNKIKPIISADYSEFSLFFELLKGGIKQNSVNEMIDNYFTHHQEKEKFQALKNNLYSLILHKLKKTQNSIEKINKQMMSEEKADKYRNWGDLIMANLYHGKDFAPSIAVFDYATEKEINIPLDETKPLKDNAQRFYKLYNKGKMSALKMGEQLESLNETKSYLGQILYSIENSENISDLMEIKAEIDPASVIKVSKTSSIEPKEIHIGDFRILIGKNNKQNDYIISKLAKDEDIWFHTKDCAGSHVLLKGQNPDDEIILKCAEIAKEHSGGKNSSKIGVIYTKRKYLRKPPKANLGYVTYKNEKEIVID